MTDPTENIRRAQQAVLNGEAAALAETPDPRAEFEARYGQVWNTSELQEEFSVTGFMAPYVVVRRKSDDQAGSLLFAHGPPRFYHSFTADA